MKVDGSCHCGRIVFEAEVDPKRVRICHCTDCQALSGSAFRVVVPAQEASFHLRSGAPKAYIKTTADSGAPRLHAFCSDCGSPVYVTAPTGEGRTFGLRVGTLKQRESLIPKQQTWLQSKLPWLPPLPGAGVERQ
jgi:hypothetical protein